MFLLFLKTGFAVPNSLALQGRLTSSGGVSQHGTYNFTFRIYDAPSGGNILWELSNHNIDTDANGIYDAILQNINLSFADQYYLGVTVGTDSESTPRINLSSSPYSFRANVSESLNENNSYIVSNLIVKGNTTIGSSQTILNISSQSFNLTAQGNINSAGNLSIAGNAFFVNSQSGYIGIGTNSPTALLQLGALAPELRLSSTIGGYISLRTNSILNTDFDVSQNGTSRLYISPNGNIGIGTIAPQNNLEIIGDVTVAGSLNASSINATTILQNGNQVQTVNAAYNSANFTSNYDARTDRYGKTNISNDLASGSITQIVTSNINTNVITVNQRLVILGNITNANVTNLNFNGSLNPNLDAIFDLGSGTLRWRNANFSGTVTIPTLDVGSIVGNGFSAAYEGKAYYTLTNFTGNYDSRTDRFGTSNYSSEYASTGYKKSNFTSDYSGRIAEQFNNQNLTNYIGDNASLLRTANISGLPFSNFRLENISNNTLTKDNNATDALWNISGNNIYPRNLNNNVGIGAINPANKLTVEGNVNISGGLNVSGVTNISNNLYVTGNTVIGSSSSNTVEVNAQIASDLVPNNNARSLGSPSNFWRFAYVDILNVNNLTASAANISGTQFPTFTINANYSGDDQQDVSLIFERGSPVINPVIKWDSTSKRFDFNFPVLIEANQNFTVDSNTLYVEGTTHRIGIGTTTPQSLLDVAGAVIAEGTLNATSINATAIFQNNNQVQTVNAVYNSVNFTSNYDARTDRYEKSNYSSEYSSTGYHLANFTSNYDSRADRFGTSNYSSEYASTGYKKSNFTSNYDSISDRFGVANYSAEYAATGYKLSNFTSNFNSVNSSFSLWNASYNNNVSFMYPRDGTFSVLIGDVNYIANLTNISEKLVVVGNINATGDVKISGIFYQNGNPVALSKDEFQQLNLTVNSFFNTFYQKGNFTSDYSGRIAEQFNLANYSAEYASTGYKKSNFTSDYSGRIAEQFNNQNLTNYIGDNASLLRTSNISNFPFSNFQLANGTSLPFSNFQVSNGTALPFSNFQLSNVSNDTLRISGNSSISLWNASISNNVSFIFTRDSTYSVLIGDISSKPNISEKLVVIGNVNISGYINASGDIKGANIYQNGNQVQTVNAAYNSANFTGNYEGRTDRFGIANGTALPFSNFQLANGTSLPFSNFRLENISNNTLSKDNNATDALWNISGSNIYPRLITGNVGIGTTTPNHNLEVDGSRNDVFLLNGSESSTTSLVISNTNWKQVWRVGAGNTGNGNFFIDERDVANRLMIENGTGRIGINTVTPGSKLSMDTGNNYGGLSIGTSVYSQVAAPVNGAIIQGNVGIGNTLPNATLDVSGNIYLSSSNPILNISGMVVKKSGNDIVITD